MDAKPFYHDKHPLRFRGVADSLAELHVEGSECCLIHVDNPQSKTQGVWLNPKVRVGYSGTAYEQVVRHKFSRWLGPLRVLSKLWENRIRRWFTSPWFQERVISRRISGWSRDSGGVEHGGLCLVNEMQVLVANGWAHV